MKKSIIAAVLVLPMLASCSQTERSTAVGAASGAVIGGVVTGRAGGALAGAAIGRSNRADYCIYRDRHGRRYEARC